MGAFSGRVSLDEDKYKEDSRPVLNCAVMYVPFEELFKALEVSAYRIAEALYGTSQS